MTGAIAEQLIYRSCLITYSIMSGTMASGVRATCQASTVWRQNTVAPSLTRSLCPFWMHTTWAISVSSVCYGCRYRTGGPLGTLGILSCRWDVASDFC
jgi:hypothetical protein